MVDVTDDFEGKAYCSIACACMDGAMSMNGFKPKSQEADNEKEK